MDNKKKEKSEAKSLQKSFFRIRKTVDFALAKKKSKRQTSSARAIKAF